MFSTDTERETLVLTNKLGRIGSWAIPTAVMNTLNNVAFEARKNANEEFVENHVIRSDWMTAKGMIFEKVKRGSTIAQMESRMGNIREDADILETGGEIKPRKNNLMSPALAARGGNKRNPIRPANRLNRLKPRRMPKVGGNPQRRFGAMLNLGRKDNYFGPFMVTKSEAGGEQLPHGIFKLAGAGRKNRGGGTIVMLRKIQDKAKIRGHRYVSIGSRRAENNIQSIYNRNAKRILSKVK